MVQTEARQFEPPVVLRGWFFRLVAGIDIERPIAIGVIKIKAKIGELLPAGKVGAGRGNKIDKQLVDFSPPTISAYRKMAKHVDKINMARRHLDPIEWGQAFKKLLAERGVVRGKGKRNELTSATVAEVADELGVAERTAEQRV